MQIILSTVYSVEEKSQAAGEMRTKASLKVAMRGTIFTPRQYVVRPDEDSTRSAALQRLLPAIGKEPNMTMADVAEHAAQYISKLDAETAELIDRLRHERLRRWTLTHRPCGKAKIKCNTPEAKLERDRKRRRVISVREDRLREQVPSLAETSPRHAVALEAARYIQALRAALTPNRLRSIDAAFKTINTKP